MGELFIHNLSDYNCNVFVETGTGKGRGVDWALQYEFDKLYSIEIMVQLYDECVRKYINNTNLTLINDSSVNGLSKVLDEIDKDDNILFWLDAHFPGADFQLGNYDDDYHESVKLPLENEIRIIYEKRKGCKDTFIIDDLQLFEEGDYELKWEQDFIDKFRRSNSFLYARYGKTHNFIRNYRHQGFLILEPKNDIDITQGQYAW